MRREDAQHIMQIKRRALTSSAPVHETVRCHYGEEIHTFDLLVTPDVDETGALRGITCITVELTESLKRVTRGSHRRRTRPSKSPGTDSSGQVRIGDVLMSSNDHSLTGPIGSVRLTRIEGRLLKRLIEEQGRVVAREELLEHVWGPAYISEAGLLHDAVSRLRHRFRETGLASDLIQTVHGVGYVLSAGREP